MKTKIGLTAAYSIVAIVNAIAIVMQPPPGWWWLWPLKGAEGSALGVCLVSIWNVCGGRTLWALLDLRGKLDIILGRLPWLNRSRRLIRFRNRFLSPNPFRLGYRFWDVAIWLPPRASFVRADMSSSAWRESVSGRFVLQAIGSFYAWSPGPNIADCREHGPLAPVKDCGCGFWSRSSISGIKFYRRSSKGFRLKEGLPTVIGAVVSWGKVIHHSLGTRSEKAMVIALLAEPNRHRKTGFTGGVYEEVVRHLAAYYDVPVLRSSRELKRYAKQYLRNEREALRRMK